MKTFFEVIPDALVGGLHHKAVLSHSVAAIALLIFLAPVFLQGSRDIAAGAITGEEKESISEDESGPADIEESLKWRRLGWLDEKGQIADGALMRAKQQRDASIADNRSLADSAGIAPNSWSTKGPQNVGGRTKALVVNPQDLNMMWAAAASGGIWFTSDGGSSWVPVNDFLPTLNSGTLVMKPGNPNEMYCGTGEPIFPIGIDYSELKGVGILKTTNATSGHAATWSQLSSTASWGTVFKIAISPDGNSILATNNTGIHRSTNGGISWTNTYPGGFDVVFHPTLSSNVVAGVVGGALYSTNGGVSWSPASMSNVWGGEVVRLAYAPNSPLIVYASAADSSDSFKQKVWRSTDGGVSYGGPMTAAGQTIETQGSYTNTIWVCPSDPALVLDGGVFLYRSTDSGVTFTQISDTDYLSDKVHADQQFIVAEVNTSTGFQADPRVYVCTDGGIFRTDNIFSAGMFSWINRNQSYQTTQFYDAAGDGNYTIGGTQDNASLRLAQISSSGTLMSLHGDGGFCAVDSMDDVYSYGEYTYLRIYRSTDYGFNSTYIYSGISDAGVGSTSNFIAPFALAQSDPNRMYAGGSSLWRTNNARTSATWSSARTPHFTDSIISAIAVAPGDPDIVWIGENFGQVYRTTGGGSTWTVIDNNNNYTKFRNPLPDRFVTRILIDPGDPNIVYITFGGFSEDNLYRTTNGLAATPTWSNITGGVGVGIPAVPVRCIARNPNNANWLYAGTEIGVFTSENAGATWAASNQGPGSAPVFQLFFLPNSTTLTAATFGRGMWQASANPPPPPGNNAISLNGSTQYISVPTSGSLDITGSITVEAWIKTNTITTQQSIMERYSPTGGGFALRLDGQNKVVFFTLANSFSGNSVQGVTPISLNTWHHVAGVYNGATLKIYIDGVEDKSVPCFVGPSAGNSSLNIGARGDDASFKFSGLIDEARLTSGALYTTTFTPQTCLSGTSSAGLWKFDDQTANDSSNNHNNGTLVGGPAFTGSQTCGAPPSYFSLSLNGSSADVDVPTNPSLDITQAITVEAWINTNTITPQQSIMERYSFTGGGFALRLDGQNKVVFFTLANSGSGTAVQGVTPISLNTWHHVAGVYNGGGTLKIYIDGVENASAPCFVGPSAGNSSLKIGARGDDSTFKFSGLVDEARLTAAAVYTSSFTPQPHLTVLTGTRGLWKFDSQNAADSSTNNNNGTLIGGAAFSTNVPQ